MPLEESGPELWPHVSWTERAALGGPLKSAEKWVVAAPAVASG